MRALAPQLSPPSSVLGVDELGDQLPSSYWQTLAHVMVMDSVWVADWPVESVTRTVKEARPAAVGVPEIRPVVDSVNPYGSRPETSCHVGDPTTLLAARFAV